MEIELRLEEEKDYNLVENLTREAFWNLYLPGCDEHLLIHNMRAKKEFVKALDFVAIHDNRIIGNIVYVEAKITNGDKEYNVLTFGPISVLPEYQNKGVGGKLINHTIVLAKNLGYKAILIYGYPEYYMRFGFKVCKEYNITNSEKKYPAALLVLELYPNSLKGVEGIFNEGDVYKVDQTELIEFEKAFPLKEKQICKSQARFLEMANKFLE